MFADTATLHVSSGTGGSGCVSFRREKGVPHGGPDGGDGGRGGDVIVAVDPALRTLLDFRRHPHVRAGRGAHGEGSNRTGAAGKDVTVRVPPGTVVIDAGTGEVLADLVDPGAQITVARGGRGGRGNARFASSVNQAPRQWEPGAEGRERTLRFELRLIADAGLVGHPNAGKSTLLARLSAARPKIADYPFTTLEPNLGLVDLGSWESCVVADIPGLIEGASTGKGLGTDFLRHIERTRVLLYLVDISGDDPLAELAILRAELRAHSPALLERPSALLLSKLDLVPTEDREVYFELRDLPAAAISGPDTNVLPQVEGMPCLAFSSHSSEGLVALRPLLLTLLEAAPMSGE